MIQASQCASDNPTYPPPPMDLKPRLGDDPIVDCYQWFNGVPVFVLPNNKLVSGPFTASWQAVNAAQRAYNNMAAIDAFKGYDLRGWAIAERIESVWR